MRINKELHSLPIIVITNYRGDKLEFLAYHLQASIVTYQLLKLTFQNRNVDVSFRYHIAIQQEQGLLYTLSLYIIFNYHWIKQ